VGKVDQSQHAIDQGVAKGNQGIETPPLQGVDDILNDYYEQLGQILCGIKRAKDRLELCSSLSCCTSIWFSNQPAN
jgi:hypothetical protein